MGAWAAMNKPGLEVTVGVFVVVGILLLSMVVFGVSGIYFFRPGYALKIDFNFVGIIDRGAPVRYAGVKVGEVKKMEILGEGGGEGIVRLTMFVVKGVQIYENDKISIKGTHIMAEPHIEIEPASGSRGRLLRNGDRVKGIDPISMDELILHGKEIATKVNYFLEEMGTMVKDAQGKDVLKRSLLNLSELTASLNMIVKGREEELGNALSNLSRSAEELSVLLERANRGEGTVGRLMVEDELYEDMREFVQEIKRHPWRLLKK